MQIIGGRQAKPLSPEEQSTSGSPGVGDAFDKGRLPPGWAAAMGGCEPAAIPALCCGRKARLQVSLRLDSQESEKADVASGAGGARFL